MATAKDIYRPTMSSDELLDLMELMCELKNTGNLPGTLWELYDRLDDIGHKICKGKGRPAYVATGKKKESAINMESLGASAAEKEFVLSPTSDKYRIASLPEHEQIAVFAQANHEVMTGVKLPISEFLHGGSMFNKVEGVDLIPEITGTMKGEAMKGDMEDIIIGSDDNPSDNDNLFNAFSKQYSDEHN